MGDSARLLPAAFASLLFASLSAALRVPALDYAVYVGFVCGIALVGHCPLLARFQSFDSVLVLLSIFGRALPQCSFLGVSCCNEMHGCWHCAAMMASAAALLYLSSKIVVQAAAAKDENHVHHFLFVVGGVLTTDLLLASAAFVSEFINMRKEKHAVAASAAALVSKNAHDCSFVSAGIFRALVPAQTSSSVCWSLREDFHACSSCTSSRVDFAACFWGPVCHCWSLPRVRDLLGYSWSLPRDLDLLEYS